MDKLQKIRAVAFDLDGTLVDSAPGLTWAVDNALYALELPTAGDARVITWIGNGADVLIERALTWARQEKAALRAAATFNRVDVRRPSLTLNANPSTIAISELSAFAGQGMLQATA
ncbi:HAD family hydrolase, partial [Cronobacter sakazakii]|uniref:HAD family hydrolase n=1 Tax=Cronobacter sakazakii TaxID=28141 RepID=UPI00310125E5